MPSLRYFAPSLRVVLRILAVSVILVSTAHGQLSFTHLLDSSTVRPDASASGQPTFGPFASPDYNDPLGFAVPATDGKVVTFNVGLYAAATPGSPNGFAPCSSGSENSIWTIPVGGGTPTKVAGIHQPCSGWVQFAHDDIDTAARGGLEWAGRWKVR